MTTVEQLTNLGLFVRRAFLPADLRATLCEQMQTAPREVGTVLDGSRAVVDEQMRRAKHVAVTESASTAITSRLHAIMPDVASHFGLTLTEPRGLQLLRYDEGDFFVFHRDRNDSPSEPQRVRARQVSVVIFLNPASERPATGAYGGGALEFYLPDLLPEPGFERAKFSFPALPGTLVAFDPRARHQVRQVTHGQRYTVVTWFV